LLYTTVALFQHSFTDFCLHLAGCARCVPGAGEGPRADQEAAADAESNPRLALPPQVPEDADQLRHAADVHAWIPLPAEIPTGNLSYSLITAILIIQPDTPCVRDIELPCSKCYYCRYLSLRQRAMLKHCSEASLHTGLPTG